MMTNSNESTGAEKSKAAFVYVVRKDGMYLIGYRLSNIVEFDSHGKLMPVYTCVWGDKRKGAKAYAGKNKAAQICEMLGADDIERIVAEVGDDECLYESSAG